MNNYCKKIEEKFIPSIGGLEETPTEQCFKWNGYYWNGVKNCEALFYENEIISYGEREQKLNRYLISMH